MIWVLCLRDCMGVRVSLRVSMRVCVFVCVSCVFPMRMSYAHARLLRAWCCVDDAYAGVGVVGIQMKRRSIIPIFAMMMGSK